MGPQKKAEGVSERVLTINFGCSHQLLPNKFFDSSISSMRKVDEQKKNGLKPGWGWEENNDGNSCH